MKMINKKIWTLTLICTMIFSMSTMVSQVKAEDPISPPSLSYSYNDISDTLTITSVDSGYYYAEGAFFTQANIAFSGEGISLFILENYSVGTQGIGDADLITNEIQAGNVLSGFPAGTYNIVWMPTAEVIGTVTFTDWSVEASPSYIPLGKTSSVVISVSEAAGSSNDGVYVRLHGCGVDQSGTTDSNGEVTLSLTPSATGTINIDVGPSYGDTVSEVITVTAIQEAPSLSYSYNDISDTLTITSVDPGYYYAEGASFGQANLVFDGDGVTLFVLNGYVVGTQGLGDNDCLTSMIQAGNVLSGFPAGTYNIVWMPTAEIIGTITFTEEIITPQISFIIDLNDKTIKVVSISSSNILWDDIEISGTCDTSGLGTLANAGDQITNCYGRITITYIPTNAVLFIWDFPEKIPAVEYGWIYGTVYIQYGNYTGPLANAIAYYRPLRSTSNNAQQIWRVTFTDKDGNYFLELKPDTYELKAGRRRPSSEIVTIQLAVNETVKQNFNIKGIIQSTGDKPIDIINNTKLVEAIKNGTVGGEITIWQNNSKLFEQEIMLYDGISIPSLDVEKGKISLIVSGDENSAGKTIAIATSLDIFDLTKDFVVEYDGEILNMADNTSDVLNPNDDGLHAEYLITIGTDGVEILISIPHFSEHEIIISTLELKGAVEDLVESVGGPEAAMFYVSICVIASVLFIGTIYIRRRF